ncbi:hypothetical protein ACTXGQ_04355 [Marinobacter sp. 1Y8]
MTEKTTEKLPGMLAPTLTQSIFAAQFVTTVGVGNVGVKTKLRVMWPYYELDDALVAKEAAELLIGVLTALLEDAPRQGLDRISKGRDERLSFVCAP